MKVVYLWPYTSWGGAQIYLMSVMRRARTRWDILVLLPLKSDPQVLGYLQQLGVESASFDTYGDEDTGKGASSKIRRRIGLLRTSLSIIATFNRQIEKTKLVHVDAGPWTWFGLLAYLSLRTHVFLTLHSAIPQLPWHRRLVWRAKLGLLSILPQFHLLASNCEMLESLRRYVPERIRSRIPVAYTGIERDEIEQAMAHGLDRSLISSKFGLPQESLYVFSVGQLVPLKGYDVLIEVIARLQTSHPKTHYVWIGDGPEYLSLQLRLQEQGIAGAVRIIRPTEIGPSRSDFLALFAVADLFVHPSFREGLPGALLEAMALGKACIATSVNAIPEAIENGENGLLVRPGDPVGLASALDCLLNNPDLRQRLGVAAREYVLKHFSAQAAAEVTINYYCQLRGNQ